MELALCPLNEIAVSRSARRPSMWLTMNKL